MLTSLEILSCSCVGIGNETSGFDCADTAFCIWIMVAAVAIVALFCVVEAVCYQIKLDRAVKFKDKDA
ncbi:MAG: hypothetical protein ACI35M_02710 [Alistipes sp.]